MNRSSEVREVPAKRCGRTRGLALILAAGSAMVFSLSLLACGQSEPSGSPAGAEGAQSHGPSGGQERSGSDGNRADKTIPIQAQVVERGELTSEIQVPGSVLPSVSSSVAAQVSGVVSQVLKKAGDWVNKGDLVIKIDDAQLRLSLSTASASLENAKINLAVGQENVDQAGPKLQLQVESAQSTLAAARKAFDSAVALYKLGGISASELDDAQARLQSAQANYESAKIALEQNKNASGQNIAQLKIALEQASNQERQARLNLDLSSIRAPFSGQIAAINVAPGEYVSQNTAAFVLVSREREIRFSVSPSDAALIVQGAGVSFVQNGQAFPARIAQSPSAPINNVVSLSATLQGDAAPAYGSVGTVNLSLVLSRGVLVPVAALQTNENKNFLFAVVDGRVKRQELSVVSESGSLIVAQGIAPGTTVVLNPPPGLLEDSAVAPILNGAGAGDRRRQEGGQRP